MILHLRDGDGANLLGDQAGEPLAHCHAQPAHALAPQSQRGGEHEVGAIRFQQIDRAHVGSEPLRDQGHHVGQHFGGLATITGEFSNLLHRQYVTALDRKHVFHFFNDLVVWIHDKFPVVWVFSSGYGWCGLLMMSYLAWLGELPPHEWEAHCLWVAGSSRISAIPASSIADVCPVSELMNSNLR